MRFGVKILIGLLVLSWFSPAWSETLSDIDREIFERGPVSLSPSPRSPFVPTYRVGDEVDLTTVLVQGILYSKSLRMAVLSGRILREGERLGKYTIDKIEPDGISVSHDSITTQLPLENYVAPVGKRSGSGYVVEFRNVSLRDALRFLSKASDLNLIMPEDLSGRVTVSFEAIDIMEAIRSILRVNGYEYANESGVIRIGKPDSFVGGTDLRAESYRLKYATAKDLVEKVKLLLSDRGSVISDDRTNTLTVKDRDAIVSTISNLIGQIDRRDQQVQIEARIVDASKNFSRAIGIQWGFSGRSGNMQMGGSNAVGTSATTSNPLNVNLGAASPTSGLGLIMGNIAGSLDIEGQLTAAESNGDIHILSKPSVTTLNNIAAKIRSGTKIYVKSTSSINVGTTGGAASAGSAALQEIDTGIELTVTPQISSDRFIRMRIDAVESEADFSRTVDGIPSVIDNTASTSVILKDGETTVIGGMYRVKSTKEKRGVPGLQSVPVMGLLFQSKVRTKEDRELMIFITPRIIGS